MPRAPPKKRQRVDESPQPQPGAMQTRSKASTQRAAPPPQPASKSGQVVDITDTDDDMLGGEDDEEAFEYESDIGSAAGGNAGAEDGDEEDEEGAGEVDDERDAEIMVLSSDDDSSAQEPPPELPKAKGKLTARKQFALDIDDLWKRFAGTQDELVTGFKRDDGDDMVRFSLKHPKFPRGLKLSLMFPELGGYPKTHEVMCFTENEDVPPEVEVALGEVAHLPKQADRSLNGVVEFLIHRIVRLQPNPWATAATQQDTDDENFDYEDELMDAGINIAKDSELMKALRSDFKQLLDAGFRPGFTRVSELELVVSVSKRVNLLGVPARALQAWDSRLITGKIVYLVCLMSFGRYPVDLDNQTSGQVKFKVGISPKYKPSKAAIASAFRAHTSNPYTSGEFEAISLSNPLDALMNDKFQEILFTRRCNDRVGWAGAEQHCFQHGKTDTGVEKKKARAADKEEKDLSEAHAKLLPRDPMSSSSTANNFPLLAFSYLVRRFIMCPRFCLNCYKRCDEKITSLKPFVCDNPLCLFQLIQLGLGPSLEHEITSNTAAVDLLVQLAYIGAKEGGLKGELLPNGLGLQVPETAKAPEQIKPDDPTVDFDSLTDENQKRAGIAALIAQLPPIDEMRRWLLGLDMTDDERLLNKIRKLTDMRDGKVPLSAWRLLRFIVASNTAYLKQIDDPDELVQGVPCDYRQFKLIVGSPLKEHLFTESVKAAQAKDSNAVQFPTLFAWHGSATKNWHSILRTGLHYREVINGRAYGAGCYFAREGEVSLGHYAQPTSTMWKNADFPISKMAAICEITNLPTKFVSNNPYFVVSDISWITCRYLLVQRMASFADGTETQSVAKTGSSDLVKAGRIKTLALDPKYPITLNRTNVEFPDVGDKLEKLEKSLSNEPEDLHDSDTEILKEPPAPAPSNKLKRTQSGTAAAPAPREVDKFVPADAKRLEVLKMLPPPKNPNKAAVSMIQREMKSMLKVQAQEGPTRAGFYFDPERSNDNLFNWIVELPLESFDQDIPLAKDMRQRGVKSILMEIRFGDTYPFSPPFFRVVHPRFMPFIRGGGGHVTGGGSICMDLLTSDGWSSVYTIDAILLQIRMSNLEPRPGRLDERDWNVPYNMDEAIAGFRRAAATHGWTVPAELDAFARQG
ncbi:hypothetical protein JCM10049v2_004273 [Rhodotorula toruloides]